MAQFVSKIRSSVKINPKSRKNNSLISQKLISILVKKFKGSMINSIIIEI